MDPVRFESISYCNHTHRVHRLSLTTSSPELPEPKLLPHDPTYHPLMRLSLLLAPKSTRLWNFPTVSTYQKVNALGISSSRQTSMLDQPTNNAASVINGTLHIEHTCSTCWRWP